MLAIRQLLILLGILLAKLSQIIAMLGSVAQIVTKIIPNVLNWWHIGNLTSHGSAFAFAMHEVNGNMAASEQQHDQYKNVSIIVWAGIRYNQRVG